MTTKKRLLTQNSELRRVGVWTALATIFAYTSDWLHEAWLFCDDKRTQAEKKKEARRG